MHAYIHCAITVMILALTTSTDGQTRRAAVELNSPLELTPSTSPNFVSLLDGFFPGLTTAPNFEIYKPYITVIHNTSASLVKAYTIRWDSDLTVGSAVPVAEYHYAYRMIDDGSLNNTIRPGEYRLVSPFFSLGQRGFSLDRVLILRPVFDSLTHHEQVIPVLDMAVLRDGSVYGSDTLRTWQEYVFRRSAEHDVALSLSAPSSTEVRSSQPVSLATLLSKSINNDRASLEASRSVPVASDMETVHAHSSYLKARIEAANRLLELYHRLSPSAFNDLLQTLGSQYPAGEFSLMSKWHQ